MKDRIEQLANEICFADEIALRIVTQAVNEALELAARECEIQSMRSGIGIDGEQIADGLAAAIRKMKVSE